MKEQQIDITDSQITITVEIDGEVHLVAMDKDALEAVSFLIKRATKHVIPSNRSQYELVRFLRGSVKKDE